MLNLTFSFTKRFDTNVLYKFIYIYIKFHTDWIYQLIFIRVLGLNLMKMIITFTQKNVDQRLLIFFQYFLVKYKSLRLNTNFINIKIISFLKVFT